MRKCGEVFATFMHYVRTDFDSKQLNEETDLVQVVKLADKGAGGAMCERREV